MMLVKLYRQRIQAILCLSLLSSCASDSCRDWGIQTNITKHKPFDAGRIYLAPETANDRLEIEIVNSQTGLRMYINLLFLHAKPCGFDSTKTEVEIIFEEDNRSLFIYPTIFEGGQRLLVSEDVTAQLIDYLSAGAAFTLKVGRFSSKIVGTGFSKVYEELISFRND